MSEKAIIYSEPADYFPKEVREEFFPEINVDAERYNEIARTMLIYMLENKKDQNIVFSPYSIYAILNMLSDSTSGNTKNEVARFLGDSDTVDTLSVMNRHMKESSQFISSNAAIVKNELKDYINDSYKKLLKDKYSAEYISSADLINDVNNWVNEKTKGMIPEIANDSMTEMVAALLNAVAFQAEWAVIYEEDDIYDGDFKNTDKSISKVPMLHSSEDFYIENEFFEGFIKPYEDLEFSFVGLRPRKNSKSFLKRAIMNMNITELYDSAVDADVRVSIPEYKIEYDKELSDVLKAEGIKQAFTDNADFSPMSSEVPLKVDSILHKAYIEVDRNGTKASAVTMMAVACGCAPDFDRIKYVRLNHPFVYAIMHNKTHLPIFVGVVNQL